jgi:hypothetical protein
MTAQETIQRQIDAQQRLDTIEYGIRALRERARTGTYSAGDIDEIYRQDQYGKQILRACQLTGEAWDLNLDARLREARDAAREELREAKAARKGFGGIRQLRLALAETAADTFELAAAA